MSATTYVKWFWNDWRGDPGVQASSYAARGLWFEMLGIMYENGGHLRINGRPINAAKLAKMTGGETEEVVALLQELRDNHVFSETKGGHPVIFSRRCVRDLKRRQDGLATGRTGGVKKRAGFIYIVGRRRADRACKVGVSANPTNRARKIRHEMQPEEDVQLLQSIAVPDMARAEEAFLGAFPQAFQGRSSGQNWLVLSELDIDKIKEIVEPPGGPTTRYQIPDTKESKKETRAPRATPSPKVADNWPSDAFERFWHIYPNKVDRRGCEKKFAIVRRRLVADGVTWEEFLAGVQRYINKTDDRPWLMPATFLNQDRYNEKLAPNPGSRSVLPFRGDQANGTGKVTAADLAMGNYRRDIG